MKQLTLEIKNQPDLCGNTKTGFYFKAEALCRTQVSTNVTDNVYYIVIWGINTPANEHVELIKCVDWDNFVVRDSNWNNIDKNNVTLINNYKEVA
jgi:hypothetical protein